MKQLQLLKAVTGFVILFLCYHAAEYAILFADSPVLFVLLMAVFFRLVLLVAGWNDFRLRDIGLELNRKALTFLLAGLFIGLLYAGAAFYISTLLDIERVTYVPGPNLFISQLLYFGLGTVMTSLSEDILTRGYLFRLLHGKIKTYLFVLISALVFVLNHIHRYNDGMLLLTHLFVAGVLLVIPLVVTGRLWLTFGIHFGMNMVYQVTSNIIHTDAGHNQFPALAVLLFCEAAVIPLAIFMAKRLNKAEPSSKLIRYSLH